MLLRLVRHLVAIYLRLLGARRHVLEAGAVSLVYYSIGPADGEPWLVLHGLGSIAASWSPVMRRLRRGCRLLVPELSALGGTRCDGDGLGIPAAVEVLKALIDREAGARPVTVLGISGRNQSSRVSRDSSTKAASRPLAISPYGAASGYSTVKLLLL